MSRHSAHRTSVVARVGGALACGAVLVGCGGSPTASVPIGPAPQPTGAVAAVEVLRGWHARREAAFVSGQPARVQSLYVAGSVAARADVALLRAYSARGLRILDLRTSVAGVRLVRWTDEVLDLRVRERLVRAVVATAAGEKRVLPRDGWHTRRVSLRPAGASGTQREWVVSSVRGAP